MLSEQELQEPLTIQVLRCSSCGKRFHVILSANLRATSCPHCKFPYLRDEQGKWSADLDKRKAMQQ